jgi:hypothetical protein
MIIKILTDRANLLSDVKQIRQEWLRDLFAYIGLDVDRLDKLSKPEVLEYFLDNDIDVIEHKGIDALEVRFEGDLIGEWGGPESSLKEASDGSLYFEVEIEHWSVIEEEINE